MQKLYKTRKLVLFVFLILGFSIFPTAFVFALHNPLHSYSDTLPPGSHEFYFDNGLRCVFIPNEKPRDHLEFGFIVNAGRRHEPPGKSGTSHLLGHILFKSLNEAIQIKLLRSRSTLWFDEYFEVDANHTLYKFSYRPTSAISKVEILETLRDFLTPKDISHEIFMSEHDLFSSEFKQLEGQYSMDFILKGKAHPGREYNQVEHNYQLKECFESISHEDILQFLNEYYIPNNVTLVIVGDFKTEKNKIELQIENLFSDLLFQQSDPIVLSPHFEEPNDPKLICLENAGGLSSATFLLPVVYQDMNSRDQAVYSFQIFINWMNRYISTHPHILSTHWAHIHFEFLPIDAGNGVVVIHFLSRSSSNLNLEDLARVQSELKEILSNEEPFEMYLFEYLKQMQELISSNFQLSSGQLLDLFYQSMKFDIPFETDLSRYERYDAVAEQINFRNYSTKLTHLLDLDKCHIMFKLSEGMAFKDCQDMLDTLRGLEVKD